MQPFQASSQAPGATAISGKTMSHTTCPYNEEISPPDSHKAPGTLITIANLKFQRNHRHPIYEVGKTEMQRSQEFMPENKLGWRRCQLPPQW